jgi:hypothetical protein
MKTNAEAGQFTKEDIDAAVSDTFIPINSSPMGRYISNISFGDYYDDLESFRLIPEKTDKFGFTSYDVRLKLKSGKEYTLRQRYDEQGQSEVQRPKSGKLEFRLDERPYSESKGLYIASGYVLEADRAKDVQYKVENPRGTSDYTEWDSRWGTRWYNFRNPAVGRGDYTLEGDIPFSGRQSFGMNPNQLFVNGFPVDEEGNRITSGGSDTSFGNIGVSIGTTSINYNDPNKASIATPIIGGGAGGGTSQAAFDLQKSERRSAYDLLYQQFDQYGLGALVAPLKGLIEENISPSEFTLRLRDTDAYKKRFAANAQRIQKGLRAISEAEYINLEDQYQNVMRNYGLPESYYTKGDMGVQQGFEKFIAGDVSATELEDRIQTAQNRVINAAPEVSKALREFYPDISNGDILAYALDPQQAITNIKRKVTAAEIGAGAMQAGLSASAARAEELQRLGITGEAARQGFQTIGSFLPRATQLGDIYAKQGMGPFTQTTAEAEVFGTPGAVEAAQKRRKLSELEQAQFGGATGIAQGALGRERAGQF